MTRIIRVGKIGEEYKNISVGTGAITYRELIKLAGFTTVDAVMAQGYGNVILDEPVHENVTAVVVSMPKFAGGALPAGLRVVDDNGTEWRPVSSDTVQNDGDSIEDSEDDWEFVDEDDEVVDDDDEVVDEVNVQKIKVAQLGSPYKIVEIVGAATYRSVIAKAGFKYADGVFAEGLGPVILDEPVAASVTSIVVSMPKFAGGNHL